MADGYSAICPSESPSEICPTLETKHATKNLPTNMTITRAKTDQVDATLFVEQLLNNVVVKEFTMLMSIVRSIVVRC